MERESLVDVLNTSRLVTVLPMLPKDFFDYGRLFKDRYANLAGKMKNNHIFLCGGDDKERPEVQQTVYTHNGRGGGIAHAGVLLRPSSASCGGWITIVII